MSQYVLPGATAPSDPELISAVRGGDGQAYGVLFERHRRAALSLARQIAGPSDAEDLVSDAFIKVLRVLFEGGGPDLAFRAYLLTAVRRLHIDRIRSNSKVSPSDQLEQFDPGVPFVDPAVSHFENTAAAKAFASLPERWQVVLWHLEVEGQKPAEVGPLLGLTANSVSALAYRAREGLRQAYLQMHMADTAAEDCRWVTERLGAYVRKGLSRRDATKVDQHLDECSRCAAVYLELTEVNSNLSAIIAPLVLGSAAAGYVAGTTGSTSAVGVLSLFAKAGHLATAHTAATTAGAAAVSAAVVAVAVAIVAANGPERSNDLTTADAQFTQPVVTPAPGGPSPPGSPDSDDLAPPGEEPPGGKSPGEEPPDVNPPGPDVVLPPPFGPVVPVSTSESTPAPEPSIGSPATSSAPGRTTDPPVISSTPSSLAPSASTSSPPQPTSSVPSSSTPPAPTSTPSDSSPGPTSPSPSSPDPTTPSPSTAGPTTSGPTTPSPSTPGPTTASPTTTAPTTTSPPVPPLPALPILGDVLIELLEDTNGTGVGDIVIYTIPVTNEGESSLIDLSLTIEPGMVPDSVDCPTELAGGEQVTCEGRSALSQADVDAGEVAATLTLSGKDQDSGETKTASVRQTHELLPPPVPSLTVIETVPRLTEVNGFVGVNAGDQIDYSFAVENTGALTLTDVNLQVRIQDDTLEPISCDVKPLLPGAATNCAATYVVTPSDVDLNGVKSQSTALGRTPQGDHVASPLSEYTVETTPAGVDVTMDDSSVSSRGQGLYMFRLKADTQPLLASPLTFTMTIEATGFERAPVLRDHGWTCLPDGFISGTGAIACAITSAAPPAIKLRAHQTTGPASLTAHVDAVNNADPVPSNNDFVWFNISPPPKPQP
ncbi:MAG: sigma-70 family RNA polymerase sigma factor [Nocardioidaceae bacterium]|nr:sigma-70 family RNA polymerase sigma factor [Nocardioidaceae bacterium]